MDTFGELCAPCGLLIDIDNDTAAESTDMIKIGTQGLSNVPCKITAPFQLRYWTTLQMELSITKGVLGAGRFSFKKCPTPISVSKLALYSRILLAILAIITTPNIL